MGTLFIIGLPLAFKNSGQQKSPPGLTNRKARDGHFSSCSPRFHPKGVTRRVSVASNTLRKFRTLSDFSIENICPVTDAHIPPVRGVVFFILVPMRRMGTRGKCSFPRFAWECSRDAPRPDSGDAERQVHVPTRSVGTRKPFCLSRLVMLHAETCTTVSEFFLNNRKSSTFVVRFLFPFPPVQSPTS